MTIRLQCSEHAKNRIKERMGVSDKRKIKEITKNAYHRGLNLKKHYFPKDLLYWIDKKVNKNYCGRCSQFRVYKGFLFLYSKTLTLVTIIPIPKRIQPLKSAEELIRY